MWRLAMQRIRRSVFDADAHGPEGDQARGQVAQKWNAEKGADVPWDTKHLLRTERVGDDSLLRLRLEKLDDASGPFALALDFF